MLFSSYQIQNLGFVFLKYSFCLPNEILNGHDMIRYNTLEEFFELIFCFCFFFKCIMWNLQNLHFKFEILFGEILEVL
jgi:hypothetical protein